MSYSKFDCCPICRRTDGFQRYNNSNGDMHNPHIICEICGDFTCELGVWRLVPEISEDNNPTTGDYWKIVCAVHNAPRPLSITYQNYKQIFSTKRPNIDIRALHFLQFLYKNYELRRFSSPVSEAARLCSWSYNSAEIQFLTEKVLLDEGSYLTNKNGGYEITAKGLRWLEGAKTNESKQVFVAMWFDSQMDEPYRLGLQRGIETADGGYFAFKINDKNHNNKIDDEIVAEIKRSKFLIADFTDHRGGVYYEAGLAQGLGLPVIWTCRSDEISKLHFDVRQYNCILWEADKLDAFAKQVRDRINATIT